MNLSARAKVMAVLYISACLKIVSLTDYVNKLFVLSTDS